MAEAESWWSSTSFWRKTAIWVTAASFVVLIVLTFDSMSQIMAGTKRVPAYAAINHHIAYTFDDKRHVQVPTVGAADEPLFGRMLSAEDAEAMVTKGKLTVQAKNCMDCHTLLGNGAYYAPDLTKAWLDPMWGPEDGREQRIAAFLMDPGKFAYNNLQRKMPNLGITEEEAHGVVAFLKWMSSIDTNGFPYNFPEKKESK
jgi:nitric oxide reductase subunit C